MAAPSIASIAAKNLTHSVFTIPNILSASRLASVPFIVKALAASDVKRASLLFAGSATTDFLDGFIARNFNQSSVLGSLLDPIADKSLMIAVGIMLGKLRAIPPYVAWFIVGRDALVTAGAFSARAYTLHQIGQLSLANYFRPHSVPSVEIRPSAASKVNMALQSMLYVLGLVRLHYKKQGDDRYKSAAWCLGGAVFCLSAYSLWDYGRHIEDVLPQIHVGEE